MKENQYKVVANEVPHDHVGAAFAFSFSGAALLDRSDPFETQTLKREGMSFEIDPPLRLGSPTWRPMPQFTNENIKKIIPGAPDDLPLLRMAVHPGVDANGQPTLQVVYGDDESIDLPADTFFVFAYGAQAVDRGNRVAEGILRDVFEWIRVETKQWWIGRPSEAITGNLNLVLPMTAPRHIEGHPIGLGQQTSPSIGTKKLTGPLWAAAIEKVRNGQAPPASKLLLSDAAYHLFSKDYRSSVVVICGAFEMARDDALERKHVSKKRLSSDSDLLKHLSQDFEALVGRNLRTEDQELFSFLKSVWIARGHLAHGKPMEWIVDGEEQDFRSAGKSGYLERSERLLDWINAT